MREVSDPIEGQRLAASPDPFTYGSQGEEEARQEKENNDYLMGSYQEMLTSGENVDNNLIAGDLNSYLIQTINGVSIVDPVTGEELIQQMPPTKLMKDEYITIFETWVLNGMPETAEDAEVLVVTETE